MVYECVDRIALVSVEDQGQGEQGGGDRRLAVADPTVHSPFVIFAGEIVTGWGSSPHQACG